MKFLHWWSSFFEHQLKYRITCGSTENRADGDIVILGHWCKGTSVHHTKLDVDKKLRSRVNIENIELLILRMNFIAYEYSVDWFLVCVFHRYRTVISGWSQKTFVVWWNRFVRWRTINAFKISSSFRLEWISHQDQTNEEKITTSEHRDSTVEYDLPAKSFYIILVSTTARLIGEVLIENF